MEHRWKHAPVDCGVVLYLLSVRAWERWTFFGKVLCGFFGSMSGVFFGVIFGGHLMTPASMTDVF